MVDIKPDVVIVDSNLPDICGVDAIPLILKWVPAAQIILLSDQEENRYSQVALKLGAVACIRKELIATDLVPVISNLVNLRVPSMK
jgi:DNA-binding NarL/FixJ family response regulator